MPDKRSKSEQPQPEGGQSALERLPPELVRENENISSNLDEKDIANARLASKSMNVLFAPLSDIAKLIHFVQEANYVEAKNMIKVDPKLMFKHIAYKKADGSYGTISPLKLAFKNHDTHMWKMFLETILDCHDLRILNTISELRFPNNLQDYKNDPILVSGKLYFVNAEGIAENAKIQYPELLKLFAKQLAEQEDHIRLKPLFEAYKTYESHFRYWRNGTISYQSMLNAWRDLGKQQRDLLPYHMLREFCGRGEDYWSDQNSFKAEDTLPPDGGIEIFNSNLKCTEPLLPLVSHSGFGIDFTLVRGDSDNQLAIASTRGDILDLYMASCDDCHLFKELNETRTNELIALRSHLKPPSPDKRLTAKSANVLFAPASSITRLIDFVREANYEGAEEIITVDPKLMFTHVTYEKDDGDYETISPLKLAFKNLDTYMWKMFLEKIFVCDNVHILKDFPIDVEKYKNSHILVSGKLYAVNAEGKVASEKVQNPELFELFVKQLAEQEDHINLNDLFAGYETYDDEYNFWLQQIENDDDDETRSERIEYKNLQEAWLNLGMMQREMPRHMLKQFCSSGDNLWCVDSEFDAGAFAPPNCTEIINESTDCHESVLPLVSDVGLGIDFALIKGEGQQALMTVHASERPDAHDWHEASLQDLQIFRQLYAVRTNDLDTLRSQFDLSPEITHKM